jgi:hypothetical protein
MKKKSHLLTCYLRIFYIPEEADLKKSRASRGLSVDSRGNHGVVQMKECSEGQVI